LEDDRFLLEVEDLRTYFRSREGTIKAVDGVSFRTGKGETLGIAGESGCGKSVTAQSILRIVPKNGHIVSGRIYFDFEDEKLDLTRVNAEGKLMQSIRGGEIAMIFQEPMTSFSPVHTIGNQIMETIMLHRQVRKEQARRIAMDLLNDVGIPNPDHAIDEYTFNLSGGMRQRAMIAMALSCQPRLLIADEPTTAVDVTIQAQVLELMKQVQSEYHMGMIVITHDTAVIAEMADRVLIMYLGKGVEYGTVDEIFYEPKHPYTAALMDSVLKLEFDDCQNRKEGIAGSVPSPYEIPEGCPFHPRCSQHIVGVCEREDPPQVQATATHSVHCHLYD
jgi:peptide/nickel transport system ATP-binding protein